MRNAFRKRVKRPKQEQGVHRVGVSGLNFKMSVCPESSANYEETFAHRFTADDKEYQEYLQRASDPPPIVEDWRVRGGGFSRGRDNRFQDFRGPGRGRDRSHGSGWSGEQRNVPHWQDRRWGSGGREYSQHPGQYHSYGQGYNSHSQKPQNY
ncbi:hypothetical protein MATL_G00101140 [Megalops atlanticus]|uniref:RNA guanine-7 methyltransferase activating subunit n=1 Tax=Megalops atlanticus TaxID=7932 RepID=A0A9D3Q3P1_MEGAT|nr:hypothetical protein MATL_G00101140 [Megalops atlanticus]